MQLEMFTDPLREKALEVIERALKGSDLLASRENHLRRETQVRQLQAFRRTQRNAHRRKVRTIRMGMWHLGRS